MTHNEIYIKFMIEYDKANVTSSYPSYTQTEIATILNKAYLALIGQKVTGNNPRQAAFESDSKAISDIQPLLTTVGGISNEGAHASATNSRQFSIPQNFMYYISGTVDVQQKKIPVLLLSHENAQKFKQTLHNDPWIKNAVAYIEGNKIIVLYDPIKYTEDQSIANYYAPDKFNMTYVKQPTMFNNSFSGTFELSDTMAEELISLAVTIALENVESTRLQTKAQMRGLEA